MMKNKKCDGNLPVLYATGNGIAEAWENSVVELADKGAWYKRSGRKDKDRIQVDSTMIIEIKNQFKAPFYHRRMTCGPDDLVEYQMEILGAKDSWVDPTGKTTKWTYHYHERMAAEGQIEEMARNLSERPHTRQATATTWNPKIDSKSGDPPCLQRDWFALVPSQTKEGVFILNQNYNFRSRNVMIASPMNGHGLATFQRDFRDRLQGRVDFGIECGRMVDYTDSYHVSAQDQQILQNFLDYRDKSISEGKTTEDRSYGVDESIALLEDARPRITKKIQNTTINQLEEKKWDAKAIGAELKNIDSISERVGNINKTWGQ
jgi:thymidylate synthase